MMTQIQPMVPASITSPYGMRFHPILRYWKLHDGTDFGASCGSVLRAPYSGRVAERYYNSAYGNRLMIDHGSVDGRYVTTGLVPTGAVLKHATNVRKAEVVVAVVCDNFKPATLRASLLKESRRSPNFEPRPAWHSRRLHLLILSACTANYFEILCEHAAQIVVAAMPATLSLATGHWE